MTQTEPKVVPQPTSAFKDSANKSVLPIEYEEGHPVEDADDLGEDADVVAKAMATFPVDLDL